MTCISLQQAVNTNNVRVVEQYLQDNHGQSLPYYLEDIIISEHKEQLLRLLIKYNRLSEDAISLSGAFSDDTKVFLKIENL